MPSMTGLQWGSVADWAAVLMALFGVAVTAAAFLGAAVAAIFTYRQARASERQVALTRRQVDIAQQARDDALRAAEVAETALTRREANEQRRYELTYAQTVDQRAPILSWEILNPSAGPLSQPAKLDGRTYYDKADVFEEDEIKSAGLQDVGHLGPGWGQQFWSLEVDQENAWRRIRLSLDVVVRNSGESTAAFTVAGDYSIFGGAGPLLLAPGAESYLKLERSFTVPELLEMKMPSRVHPRKSDLSIDGHPVDDWSDYPAWRSTLTWRDTQGRVEERQELTGHCINLVRLTEASIGVAELTVVNNYGRAQPAPRRYLALEDNC